MLAADKTDKCVPTQAMYCIKGDKEIQPWIVFQSTWQHTPPLQLRLDPLINVCFQMCQTRTKASRVIKASLFPDVLKR